jgi:hypothetical protein
MGHSMATLRTYETDSFAKYLSAKVEHAEYQTGNVAVVEFSDSSISFLISLFS